MREGELEQAKLYCGVHHSEEQTKTPHHSLTLRPIDSDVAGEVQQVPCECVCVCVCV